MDGPGPYWAHVRGQPRSARSPNPERSRSADRGVMPEPGARIARCYRVTIARTLNLGEAHAVPARPYADRVKTATKASRVGSVGPSARRAKTSVRRTKGAVATRLSAIPDR